MKKIPLFQPNITRKELKAVENVLKSKQLSRGPCVEIFEQQFAKQHANRKQQHEIVHNHAHGLNLGHLYLKHIIGPII